MIELQIDGRPVQADPGSLLIDAAAAAGIAIPSLLTTGRVLSPWHGGEMTRRSAIGALCPEPQVEIHPADARRGELRARAWITERVPEGIVFGNFHFPAEGNVNNLTLLALDPVAKIPECKMCAVRAEPLTS
jgi:formate dehydrogenase major subunit/formate dehydrogenase alpha subunit